MAALRGRPVVERRCLIDSSAYYALLDQRDTWHNVALSIAKLIDGWAKFTTNAVLFETHALVLTRLHAQAGREFLQDVQESSTGIIRVTEEDEARAREIIFRYTDKDFSYTDALSFAVMERLGISRAFTFDRHFEQYGFAALAAP